MGSTDLTIGLSPCPNDTFIFFALLHGHVNTGGLRFRKVHLEDVETLNKWALKGALDVSKLSYHAYGHVRNEYMLLTSGSALGRGCGPLLVCRQGISRLDLGQTVVAIPGKYTTAAMLLRLFAPECTTTRAERFDNIMPMIIRGEVDAGVIIHESRFTYKDYGLQLVKDLGEWWEDTTQHPIPLGGICARRNLGASVLSRLDFLVRESVKWAMHHPETAWVFIKEHAQELDDEVIRNHINLYVNDFSIDLGKEGKEAVSAFLRRGVAVGLIPQAGEDWKADFADRCS